VLQQPATLAHKLLLLIREKTRPTLLLLLVGGTSSLACRHLGTSILPTAAAADAHAIARARVTGADGCQPCCLPLLLCYGCRLGRFALQCCQLAL
jgi:hypothetical protein